VDQSGRETIQKIMNLFVQNEMTNPDIEIGSNAIRSTLVITGIVAFIALIGVGYVIVRKKEQK
jgi:hypothetical protein